MRHLGFVLLLLLLLLLIESEACTFSDDDYHAIEKLQNFTSWADSRAECSRKCTVECCTHPVGILLFTHWSILFLLVMTEQKQSLLVSRTFSSVGPEKYNSNSRDHSHSLSIMRAQRMTSPSRIPGCHSQCLFNQYSLPGSGWTLGKTGLDLPLYETGWNLIYQQCSLFTYLERCQKLLFCTVSYGWENINYIDVKHSWVKDKGRGVRHYPRYAS